MSLRSVIASILLMFLMVVPSARAGNMVNSPAAGSVEESIKESLKLIRDGKLDAWVKGWCDPQRCQTLSQIEDLKRYGLKRATTGAGKCLHGKEEGVDIVRWRGDPATDNMVTVYIQCEEGRMPVPSTHTKVDGKWKVSSFSW
jgi:hypothetical protein